MKKVLITPSYGPDFERCKLLCESVRRYVSSYDKHVVIVDECDLDQFHCLENDKTEIVTKESTFQWSMLKVPGSQKWWFSFRSLPVRGWILQQLIKLSVAEFIDADVYIFADSDMTFIRPFDLNELIDGDQVELFSTQRPEKTYFEPRHKNWYRLARKMFSGNESNYLHTEYISQLICWRRDILLKMYDHMNNYFGGYWKQKLCNELDLSEYILYGTFVDEIIGERSGHFKSAKERVCCSWHYPINKPGDLNDFLDGVPQNKIAVHIQSNLGIESRLYEEKLGLLQAN